VQSLPISHPRPPSHSASAADIVMIDGVPWSGRLSRCQARFHAWTYTSTWGPFAGPLLYAENGSSPVVSVSMTISGMV
jgi:hypothetical protein